MALIDYNNERELFLLAHERGIYFFPLSICIFAIRVLEKEIKKRETNLKSRRINFLFSYVSFSISRDKNINCAFKNV